MYMSSKPAHGSHGGLAQLARAPALQAGGQRFESVILHHGTHRRRFRRGTREFIDILHKENKRAESHAAAALWACQSAQRNETDIQSYIIVDKQGLEP